MSVTFKEAQKLVQDRLEQAGSPLIVADWGLENDKYWWVEVGFQEWLIGHDRDYQLVDDVITLVDKKTGKIKEVSYWDFENQVASFTQTGPVPDYFKLDPEDQE